MFTPNRKPSSNNKQTELALLQLLESEGQRWRSVTKEKNTTAEKMIEENVKQTTGGGSANKICPVVVRRQNFEYKP